MMIPKKEEEDYIEVKPIHLYQVRCPKCKAMPGYPCTFGEANTPAGKKMILDVWSIHISRVLLYEAYALGTVNESGIWNKCFDT